MLEAYYEAERQSKVRVLDDPQEILASYEDARNHHNTNCRVWISVEGNDDGEIDWLQNNFQLHPLVIEDILHRNQRSKLEEYRDYLFMVLHFPVQNEQTGELDWEELHIAIGRHWLITSIEHDAPHLKALIASISKDTEIFDRGLSFILYRLCEMLVEAYFPITDEYDEQMDQIEDILLDKPERKLLDRIFKFKRNLVEMRRYLSPQRDVFRMLLDRGDVYFEEQTRLYFRDIYDHHARVFDMIDTLRDQVSNATDVYLSVVNNNMSQVMKRLTVITTVFMPITFITGVFGMNFGHSPQVEGDPGWYFWGCLGLIAFVAMIMFLTLKRLRLL